MKTIIKILLFFIGIRETKCPRCGHEPKNEPLKDTFYCERCGVVL